MKGAETNIIQLVNNILFAAITHNASDIHFESFNKSYRVRIRVDGLLQTLMNPEYQLANAITSHLKILAELDIGERRLPQDGHFRFHHNGLTRDCRISTCPTIHGEKVVVRLLNPEHNLLGLDQLGFTAAQLDSFMQALAQPQGMILVTGPTGSGKTVTLYAALRHLNQTTRNIISIEDPVEIELAGINQVNIKPKIGLTFANALRSFLRQDPDVIMLGEIRDPETAAIAVRAAQTGHLVLATLHSNNAVATIPRLMNMGITDYNLRSALHCVIAQRLVRKLCTVCHAENNHCDHCQQGYRGRIGVFEVLDITPTLQSRIQQGMPCSNICPSDFFTLKHAAREHIRRGITTAKVCHEIV